MCFSEQLYSFTVTVFEGHDRVEQQRGLGVMLYEPPGLSVQWWIPVEGSCHAQHRHSSVGPSHKSPHLIDNTTILQYQTAAQVPSDKGRYTVYECHPEALKCHNDQILDLYTNLIQDLRLNCIHSRNLFGLDVWIFFLHATTMYSTYVYI